MKLPVLKIHFSNGAGNNIFQYVFARLMAKAQKAAFTHPALPVLGVDSIPLPFNKSLPVSKIQGSSKRPIDYHSLLRPRDYLTNYDLKIYPEDFTLYNNRIHEIMSWFPAMPVTNSRDLVFHLRLGDRLIMKSTYKDENFVPFSEFNEGLSNFGEFDRLHIVTDMPVWQQLTAEDIRKMKFHRTVKPKDQIVPERAADYFNELYAGFMNYHPIVRAGNSVQDDFNYMRSFEKIMFQHGTLAWWAAALSGSQDVAVYGRWRGGKNINLGWTDFPGWRQWGRLTAPTRGVKQYHLSKLAKTYGLRTFVETGTRGGTTLLALRKFFDQLYSVEIIEPAFRKIQRRVRNFPNIHTYLGDSAKVLPGILKKVKGSALFWLDAHDGKNSTPILDELKAILPTKHNHVIVIDDFRYFGREDTVYPSVREVLELAKFLQPSAFFQQRFDSIVIHTSGGRHA